jgi:hypothetical protein
MGLLRRAPVATTTRNQSLPSYALPVSSKHAFLQELDFLKGHVALGLVPPCDGFPVFNVGRVAGLRQFHWLSPFEDGQGSP